MPVNPLSEIPLIDLGPYFTGSRTDKRRVADEISRACERIGFFLVSGHGVDPALVEGVRRESRAFFDLPLEQKLAIRQRKDQKGSRGYEPVGTEQLSATIGVETPPDLKESLSLGPIEMPDHPSCRTEAAAPLYRPNMWPENPAGLRPAYEAYVRALDRLGQHLHRQSRSICPKIISRTRSIGVSASCACSTIRISGRFPRRVSSALASIQTTITSPSA